ncbi:MAG: tRNA uridine-5-carboxymethylaminomethyl(34) synthesis enzyme MnmG [Chloroflexi bacterium]|nr:tRNA uridine-5-carboxymethylaminomethyl(34) synthesis enzyme MnmG [Chloroflexota bacterium]
MRYDVIVIGAGHAGCETALASARLGARTLLLTMNLDNVALMPCNPSIGGPAKGHAVREIDALGGEMARNIDRTFIQIKMLNTGKGPAVQALRAQADKKLYSLAMKHTLERQPGLDLKQALVEEIRRDESELWVKTHLGQTYQARCLVITTGTSLNGRVIVGDRAYAAGRSGELPALGLSQSLKNMGFTLGRLKTGTPPRIDARSIDFSKTIVHPGSDVPLYFSQGPSLLPVLHASNPLYPPGPDTSWRPQLPCYQVHTNPQTHEIIRQNLDRAPLFNGLIQGIGPRSCPSIEDKIVKFAGKTSHPLFLEPEGWETNEVYVQGANTSLPEDVQLALLRTIPALERVEMMRVGYAIEYDYVPPSQTSSSLESKLVPGLFFAGQINGTTGYEEAAGQGLIAGINAARKALGKPPLILRRDQAYIGVMIDDLVTRELTEPYRLLTSRAEFRLLLRQDNADLRLTPIGHELGLVGKERLEAVEAKRQVTLDGLARLQKVCVNPDKDTVALIARYGMAPLESNMTAAEFLRRQGVTYDALAAMGIAPDGYSPEVREQVEIEAKYAGYIARQRAAVERVRRLEERRIPDDFDYDSVGGLRYEAQQKLNRFHPATVGQACRVEGVTPADISLLLVHLERRRRTG